MKKWQESKFFSMAECAYQENQDLFLKLVKENPRSRLLDIGCGDGSFTQRIALKLQAAEVHGIEIDREAAKSAAQKGIKVEVCDCNQPFPFKDDYFDLITANQLVEHIYNLDNFFSQAYRLLKKEGQLIVSTVNLCSWHNIIFMILGMQPPGMHLCKVQLGNFLYGTETHGHIKLFSPKALKDVARYYGFKTDLLVVNGYYPFPKPLSRLFSFCDRNHALYLTIKMQK